MLDLFVRHPTAANLLMVAMMAIGLVSLPQLQRATFPDFETDAVSISVPYIGASAEEGEEGVCLPIEEALEGLEDLDEVRCAAREGFIQATVEMIDGGQFQRFVANVRTEIDAIDTFPDLVETPVIREANRFDNVVWVAITGPMSERDLKRYAEGVKERLMRQTPVSMVEIGGFGVPQIRIQLDPAALRRFGISLDDVARLIASQSLDLPAGTIETAGQDILVRLADKRRTPASFRDLVILGGDRGGEVRLGDVASIAEDFENAEKRVELNGERAALLLIQKTREQDTLRLKAAVEAFIEEERARAPPGVVYTFTRDTASIVQDRITLLTENGMMGLLLVLGVMTLFFSVRFSFWVALSLPVSFLAAFAAMVTLGYSINMITMVALLIALGVIMDDSIVIAENIAAEYQRGLSATDAAIEGARQVVPSVLASFVTSICIFAPLAFLDGNIGKVLAAVPVVLIVTLAASLIEAFLILPHHMASALEKSSESRFHRAFNRRFEAFRDRVVGPFVDGCIAWRYFVLGLTVMTVLIAVSLVVGGTVKFSAFPKLEGDIVEARILMPQGTPLSHTSDMVDKITAALDEVDRELTASNPNGTSLIRSLFVRYDSNADVTESGAHLATVTVDLIDNDERHVPVSDILSMWRERSGKVTEASAVTFKEPVIGPGGRAIEFRLQGEDLDTLRQAADELSTWLGAYPAVSDLVHDSRLGKPEMRLTVKEGAMALGLNSEALASQVRASLLGNEATELQVGRETIEVRVQLNRDSRSVLTDLDTLPIVMANGETVPLGAVADFQWARGLSQINRVDRVRTVTLTGEVDRALGNVNEILDDTQARFLPDLLARFPGLELSLEGERAEQEETGASMRRAFMIGLLAMYLVLSFLFRSYVEPFIVLLAIPAALIGVVFGHLALGLDLSMPSMLGLAALAGIVVNDSILLVNFVKRRAAEMGSVTRAAAQASRDRFRAVLLTSLTTIAGLLPILSETSLQAQVLTPLVTSLAFGLLSSTVLVLIVVPCAFAVLDDFGLTSLARDRRQERLSPAGD